MKGIKPSEFLDQRDNLQIFVDYILHVGLTECREFAISATKPSVDANGEFNDLYIEECSHDSFSYAELCLKSAGYCVYDKIAESIRKYLEQCDVPMDRVRKWSISRHVSDSHEIQQAFTDLAIYLVPGERIAISAVNQILFGGDDSLKGEFGHVFSDAMRSIMIAADRIAEEMLNEYEERKAHE